MKDFRKKFEKKYGIRWEFSNNNSIDRYKTFKRTRQRLMNNLDSNNLDKSSQSLKTINNPTTYRGNQLQMADISGQ